jgi:hypothetical protein
MRARLAPGGGSVASAGSSAWGAAYSAQSS